MNREYSPVLYLIIMLENDLNTCTMYMIHFLDFYYEFRFALARLSVRLKNFNLVTKVEKREHSCPMDTFLVFCVSFDIRANYQYTLWSVLSYALHSYYYSFCILYNLQLLYLYFYWLLMLNIIIIHWYITHIYIVINCSLVIYYVYIVSFNF